MGVQIRWDCDLDKSEESCVPQYAFHRLDNKYPDNVAPGYNFRFAIIEVEKCISGICCSLTIFAAVFLFGCQNYRFAKYYKSADGQEVRTLIKGYGIRFDVMVFGNVRTVSQVS